MIVYFSKKSKELYIQWGILLIVVFLGLYMIFVYSKLLTQSVSTIQIIRISSEKIDFTGPQVIPILPNTQIGEYAFVASKKGKYYYPKTCGRAKTLSINNMLYFKDKMSAETAGYVPHLDCL